MSAPDRFFAAPLGRTTDSDLAAVMTVNCYAHLFAVRAAADEFARAGGGRALIVTHAAGEAALAGAAAYAAAHAATLGLARSLAEELRPQHIAVDAVVVGVAAWDDASEPRGLVPALDATAAEALARLVVEVCADAPDGGSGRVLRLDADEREGVADGG